MIGLIADTAPSQTVPPAIARPVKFAILAGIGMEHFVSLAFCHVTIAIVPLLVLAVLSTPT